MDIGIVAKTFVRPTLGAILDAVQSHKIHAVQFNMACAGVESMPATIDPAFAERIRQEFARRELTMVAVSGTFNVIHPDLAVRQSGMRRLHTLVAACAALGTSIVTLSTGTRDPEDMWRHHPDNDTLAAWDDLLVAMREAVQIADAYDVTLAFEPEVSNVIDSARKARLLLDSIHSPRLKVVLDGANLFHTGELARMHEVLEEACSLLGPDIVLAHAKDLSHDGDAGHEAAGHGVLDYPLYIRLLRQTGYAGSLILHGLTEAQVAGCAGFLREQLGAAEA